MNNLLFYGNRAPYQGPKFFVYYIIFIPNTAKKNTLGRLDSSKCTFCLGKQFAWTYYITFCYFPDALKRSAARTNGTSNTHMPIAINPIAPIAVRIASVKATKNQTTSPIATTIPSNSSRPNAPSPDCMDLLLQSLQ